MRFLRRKTSECARGLGLIISLSYYAMVLRNQNQTRQAQLLMQIHSTLHTQENWRSYLESQYQTEFKDYQDFQENYGRGNTDFYSKIISVWWSYNSVGVLVHQGLLDAERVSELLGTMVENQWMKWGDMIKALRKDIGSPTAFMEFEYLFHRLKQIRTPEYQAERLNIIKEITS